MPIGYGYKVKVDNKHIERRCRYRLEKNGLRMHKVGNYYFLYEIGGDDSRPEDEEGYYTLDRLSDYCERLAERNRG